MILLPREAGTMNDPAATAVPVGAVVIEGTWQKSQPTLWKRLAPATPSEEVASAVSRGGTFVARMKRAKWSMSVKPAESGVLSLGSGITSQSRVTSTLLGGKRLLMPISFKYASLENERSEACWSFQPKRPTASAPFASRTGTRTDSPQMRPPVVEHWDEARLRSVWSAMDSMNPSPSVLSEMRNARMVSAVLMRSCPWVCGKLNVCG